MRIAIISLPLHTNYGGILQSYALQQVLESLGHSVTVITRERYPHYPIKSKVSIILHDILNHLNGKSSGITRYPWKDGDDFSVIMRNTGSFIHSYLNIRTVNLLTDIREEDYDAIIVGSDQVWRKIYFSANWGTPIRNAYLAFTEGWNIHRLAYAASFGSDDWEYSSEETIEVKRAIRQFNGISVREQSGCTMCSDNLGMQVLQHIDPTMLLTADDYIKNISLDSVPHSPGNLLVYLIDQSPEKSAITDYIEKSLNLSRFLVNSRAEDTANTKIKLEDRIQPSVEKWLRGFMDASFVVTDSFHACVFSILFHKPFICIGNKDRGLVRFQSLLGQFYLTDRLVSTIADLNTLELSKEINFASIDNILVKERKRSFDYLMTKLV